MEAFPFLALQKQPLKHHLTRHSHAYTAFQITLHSSSFHQPSFLFYSSALLNISSHHCLMCISSSSPRFLQLLAFLLSIHPAQDTCSPGLASSRSSRKSLSSTHIQNKASPAAAELQHILNASCSIYRVSNI